MRKELYNKYFSFKTQENQRFAAIEIRMNNEFKIEGIIPDQF